MPADMGKLTSLQVPDLVDYSDILEGWLCFTARIPEGIDSLGQSLLTFQRAILQVHLHVQDEIIEPQELVRDNLSGRII